MNQRAAGRLDLDRLLELLEQAGMLDHSAAVDVQMKAGGRLRQLERQRERAGLSDVPVSPAELVASFRLPARGAGTVTEARIQQVIADAAGVPYVDIDPLKIDATLITGAVSQAYARRNAVLPLGHQDGRFLLAVDDPFAGDVVETMRARVQEPIEVVVALRADILRVLEEVFRFRASLKGAIAELGETGTDFGNLEQLVRLGANANLDGDDSHVVRAVDFLLRYALDQSASDLHIEPKRQHSVVRLRIDGLLHPVHQLPKVVHAAVTSRIKTLARMDIAEKRRPQDGRIKIAHREVEVELRISSMPTAFGEKLVIRFFDPGVLLQEVDALGFFADELESFRRVIRRPNGLVLVTGPTGSGKTTTLYSALRAIAGPTINVATIEDPIEMVVEDFNQTATNARLGLDFSTLLRTLLRQDPDVVMVGEIRDRETAQAAVQAALTGHLVLSTVHTNDAPGAVSRMVDLGAEPFLLSTTLLGVLAQRLLRRVCLSCREETTLSPELAAGLGLDPGEARSFVVWRGQGCPVCRGTGLKGRVGVFEWMVLDERLRKMVQEGADAVEIGRAAQRAGMRSLRESALKKLALGLTSAEEVIRVTAEGG
ncbi:MAG: type II/IV secretion system protein [Deltaproteobacteria bacterium]|nr:type II/IV secretion system protein [Deltaproteobacteria bacterium]